MMKIPNLEQPQVRVERSSLGNLEVHQVRMHNKYDTNVKVMFTLFKHYHQTDGRQTVTMTDVLVYDV